MLIDILIISYVVLFAFLVRKSEELPQFSMKIILIGLLLSPISGFISYYYFSAIASK
jgi:hypothetical protein